MSLPPILTNAVTSGDAWSDLTVDTNNAFVNQVVTGYETLNSGSPIYTFVIPIAGVYRCTAWTPVVASVPGGAYPLSINPELVMVQTGLLHPYVKPMAFFVPDDATPVCPDIVVTVQAAEGDVIFPYLVDLTPGTDGSYIRFAAYPYPNLYGMFSVERVG